MRKKNNIPLPQVIVFYRDGVGDTMIDTVLKQRTASASLHNIFSFDFTQIKDIEVAAIRKSLTATYGAGNEPKLLHVVVQKRHKFRAVVELVNMNAPTNALATLIHACT